jgi:hypothetical protein
MQPKNPKPTFFARKKATYDGVFLVWFTAKRSHDLRQPNIGSKQTLQKLNKITKSCYQTKHSKFNGYLVRFGKPDTQIRSLDVRFRFRLSAFPSIPKPCPTTTQTQTRRRPPSFQLIFQILPEATLHQLLPESRF